MEYRTLELNVFSANDLNKVNLFSSMDLYVVVSLQGAPTTAASKQKTPVSKETGRNPYWNHSLKFTIDERAARQNRLLVVVRILCRQSLGPDKLVGEVNVPIEDLLSAAGNTKPQFVSYQVRKPSGKPKGVLNFSFSFGETNLPDVPFTAIPAKPPTEAPGPSDVYPPPPKSAYGYPDPYPEPYPSAPQLPVTAYPAAPAGGYQYGYDGAGGPGYAYPVQQSYGYPGQQGFGYPAQQQYGYGYSGYPPPQQPRYKKNNHGMGLGAGLLGGALAGLVVGDLVGDGFDFGGF